MSKAIVRLWNLNGVGLIISHPTGVVYSNQAGGHACLQPEMEGAFVPLVDEVVDQQADLEKYFTGSERRGHLYSGMDKWAADVVDEILASSYLTKRLKVNREKLDESGEAWIHVVILESEGDDNLQEFHGFPGRLGVVTWNNSD